MYDVIFFEEELELIKDVGLRALTRNALISAPKWFWTAPASATGKHHPPDDNVEGGNCHHTKKVIWHGYKFALELGLDTDIMAAAASGHDIAKFGLKDEMERPPNMPSYCRHGEIAAEYLLSLQGTVWPEDIVEKWHSVCSLVRTHMGKWGQTMPETLAQNILHLADVAASCRAFVALKFTDPESAPALEEFLGEREYFTEDEDGDWMIAFGGKYEGKKVVEVMVENAGYFDWMLKGTFPVFVKEQVREIVGMKSAKADDLFPARKARRPQPWPDPPPSRRPR